MVKKPIKDLTEHEKEILRHRTLLSDSIDVGLSVNTTFTSTHPRDTKKAFLYLIDYGYFKHVHSDVIKFTNDGYYDCRVYFKYPLLRKRFQAKIKTLLTFSSRTDKAWYEKPCGYIFLTVIATLIAAYLVFRFGWNASKEPNTSHAVQGESATTLDKIPKKIPSVPPPIPKNDPTRRSSGTLSRP